MKHTRVVSPKCTPGFACRAFSDTTLVCFIVDEHTTKCSRYRPMHLQYITGYMECTRPVIIPRLYLEKSITQDQPIAVHVSQPHWQSYKQQAETV